MNEIQNQLLQIIGAALFGNNIPTIKKDSLSPLIKESNAQTVFRSCSPL